MLQMKLASSLCVWVFIRPSLLLSLFPSSPSATRSSVVSHASIANKLAVALDACQTCVCGGHARHGDAKR